MPTLNAIDFMRENSRFMVKARPDLYDDEQEALGDLVSNMDLMRDTLGSGMHTFTSFILIRFVDEDGTEEWEFALKISSMVSFTDEDRVWVYGHTADSGVLKYGVDLPAVDDLDD